MSVVVDEIERDRTKPQKSFVYPMRPTSNAIPNMLRGLIFSFLSIPITSFMLRDGSTNRFGRLAFSHPGPILAVSNDNEQGAELPSDDPYLEQIPDTLTEIEDQVDIAIIGAGIGGLCAGAILNTLYGKKVGVFESHYLPGGCAHAFDRTSMDGVTFTFDSGPTILLGYEHFCDSHVLQIRFGKTQLVSCLIKKMVGA